VALRTVEGGDVEPSRAARDVLPAGVRRRLGRPDAVLAAVLVGELLAGAALGAAWEARDALARAWPPPPARLAPAQVAPPAPEPLPLVVPAEPAAPSPAASVPPPRDPAPPDPAPRDPFAARAP
jgi:hypothetical protein